MGENGLRDDGIPEQAKSRDLNTVAANIVCDNVDARQLRPVHRQRFAQHEGMNSGCLVVVKLAAMQASPPVMFTLKSAIQCRSPAGC